MNTRHWKLMGSIVLVVAMVCIVTYADKCEMKKITLPAVVKDAIMVSYPQATIEEAKMEKVFKVYEVELKQDKQELELKVAPDGTIIAIENKMAKENLPAAVSAALSKAADGATIKEVEQKVTHAVLKPIKLDKPQTSYEAELTKDGKTCEIKFAADGTIMEKSEWKQCEEKDEHKCGDKAANEQKVSIDKVPAAAKATILKEVGNGTINKIEQDTKDGKTIYETDATIAGKKVEFKVAADGTLLGKK